MPSSQNPPPPERAGSKKIRADVGDPDVLPFRPPPIPVATFARLHNARVEGDFALARRLLGEMRAYGYSIVPIATRAKGGAR
jgi:hypothetical protein